MPQAYEFVDTLIMILKKNERQISFLHVYHHATTFFPCWYTTNTPRNIKGRHHKFMNEKLCLYSSRRTVLLCGAAGAEHLLCCLTRSKHVQIIIDAHRPVFCSTPVKVQHLDVQKLRFPV